MAMPADFGSVASTVIYQEVKAWIAQQEAFEARYHRPAPLNDAQRTALQNLHLATTTPTPSPPSLSPAVAVANRVNYVGILTEYYSKRQQPDGLNFVEETSGILPGGVTGRVCRVTIVDSLAHEGGHIEHFPAEGYGLNDDGTEPCFPTKKAAKHFAAKCAVEWLVAQGLMSHHLAPSPPPNDPTPPFSTPRTHPAAGQTTDSTMPMPGKPQMTQAASGFDGTSGAATAIPPFTRATTLVVDLCNVLGFSAPKYQMIEHTPGVFSGMAHFDDYGHSELIALNKASMVRNVQGKEATKQAIAAKVLDKLQEIEAGRDAQLHLLINKLDNERRGEAGLISNQ